MVVVRLIDGGGGRGDMGEENDLKKWSSKRNTWILHCVKSQNHKMMGTQIVMLGS